MFDNFITSGSMIMNNFYAKLKKNSMTNEDFIIKQIQDFESSPKRKDMIKGDRYYRGFHDVLNKKITIIDEDGNKVPLKNMPNNKIIDNQYRKMVKQKVNYLVGKPFVIETDNEQYSNILKTQIFNKDFMRMFKVLTKDALNQGISWIYPYYNERSEFILKPIKNYYLYPLWGDAEHTYLDAGIRFYEYITYEGNDEKKVTKVEVFDTEGIWYFTYDNKLIPDKVPFRPYFSINNKNYKWNKIPIIPFKYNDDEIPLIRHVKSLQDSLNMVRSIFGDSMEQTPLNTITVLVNYDGEKLDTFKKNLASTGVIPVRTIDGVAGDVKTLELKVNAENYNTFIKVTKEAIIENGMSYNAKDDRLSGTPNEMNIRSMYNDIDLDATDMEAEIQAGLEQLLWFINCHLYNTGQGDFFNEEVKFTFNRDILMNNSETIQNIKNSEGLISRRTQLSHHPYVTDVEDELKRIKEEEEEEKRNNDIYNNVFTTPNNPDEDLDNEEQ